MGFYDETCLITGINLGIGNGATAVLLQRGVDGDYAPITLGIRGTYDGYGSIDGVDADPSVTLVTSFFSSAHRAGRFQAANNFSREDTGWFDPDISIDSLLYLVERTTTSMYAWDEPMSAWHDLWPPGTLLDGQPVVMALIAQTVWDAIVGQEHRRDDVTRVYGLAERAAVDVYGSHLDQLVEPLRQLAAIDEFIARHSPLRWAPPTEPVQRYPRGSGIQFPHEDRERFLAEARWDYRDESAIQRALDVHVESGH